jgi:hypothetical protein
MATYNESDMSAPAPIKNAPLWVCTHLPIVALPRPKLAKPIVTCQQNANTVADNTAPILVNILSIYVLSFVLPNARAQLRGALSGLHVKRIFFSH